MKSKLLRIASLLMLFILSVLFGASGLIAPNAQANGAASCGPGGTALAQLWGTSTYCAMTVCRPPLMHVSKLACIKGHCYEAVKYESRPVLPSPPSPAGGWQNQALCPDWVNTGTWY